MSASRLSSTPTTRQPSTAELNRYLSQLEAQERQMASELKAQQAARTAAYSGTFDLETWEKQRAAAKQSEDILSCPSTPRHGDNRDRTPPRIREEDDENLPGDHLEADSTGPMALLIKEQQLQRETSEKNMTKQTMEASLKAMHASQQNRAAMEAVPQCAPMKNKEDILDYLQIFEDTQQARGLLRANWAYSLLPLLNQQCRQIANTLDPAVKCDYTSLKAKLISKVKLESQHPTKSWWEWDKPGQETWQEAESTVRKKLKRCPDDLFEALLTEKLLQLMPYRTQQYVRDLKPKDACKAAELASSHFQAHHWDESKYATNIFKKPVDISKDKKDKDNYRDHNKDRHQRPNNQHRQWGPYSHNYSHKSHAHQTQDSHQHRQVITNTHKDFKENKDSGPTAHGKDTASSRAFSKPPDHSQLVCFKCGEIGHIARDCVKINLVKIPSLFDNKTSSPVLRSGKIGDKPVSMFMDSGADISVIARDLLPEDNVQCLPVLAKGFGSNTKPETLQTALFQAEINGQPLQLLAAVAPRHAMTHPVIIGRHIPGKKVQWNVTIQDDPDQPNQQQTGEAGEAGDPTSQVVEERAQDPQPPLKRTAEQQSPLAQQPNLQSADRTPPNQLTPPNLDFDHLTAAQIAAVQTRAQRRRAQQQQQPEKAATPARAKPRLTAYADIPDIPDPASEPVTISDPEEQQEAAEGPVVMPGPATAKQQEDTLENPDPPTPADRTESEAQGSEPEDRPGQIPKPKLVVTAPFTRAQLIEEQQRDPSLKQLFQAAEDPCQTQFTVKNGILYAINLEPGLLEQPSKIVVPTKLRQHILEAGHACSGHFGAKKTRSNIQQHFYWQGIGKDVAAHCKSCKMCCTYNAHRKDYQPLQPIPVVHTPWTKLAIDIVGPLNTTRRGHKYLLTMVDLATRWPEAVPLKKVDAVSTAEALLNIFSTYGVPQLLVHDNGGNFTAKFTSLVMKTMGIHQIKTAPYHPEANGHIERLNGTIKKALKKAGAETTSWDKLIPLVLYAIRITQHSTTGHSPYQLMFGRHPYTPTSSLREAVEQQDSEDIPQPVLDYLNDLTVTMSLTKSVAEEAERKAKQDSKIYQDARHKAKETPLKIGDPVLCFEPNLKKGLSAAWHGPYHIKKKLGNLTYLVDLGHGRAWKRHRNALKLYQAQDQEEEPAQIATVVLAMEDGEADDGLTLERPATPQLPATPLKLRGIDTQPKAYQQQVIQLTHRLQAAFNSEPEAASLQAYDLQTQHKKPVVRKPYRPPLSLKPTIDREIDHLLKLGIIEPSTSPWSSPVIPVPKKDGSVRLCVDFRGVNEHTLQDTYPIPRVDDLLAKVSAKQFLTTLDLTKGYHQVPLTQETKEKTAFVCHRGKFQYTRLPFGLKNAPAHFQRQMDQTLQGTSAEAYIDDIVLAHDTWEEHIAALEQVLKICIQKNLSLNLEKCVFISATLDYLGHTIGSGHILPQEAKVTAILNFPKPENRKQLRGFLGLVGYYRQHIPHFSSMTASLSEKTSTKHPRKVQWTEQMTSDFEAARKSILTAPLLAAPDMSQPFYLQTDACQSGIGAVLQQEKNGGRVTIAFYSKKLNRAQQHYAATELELFALTQACQHFKIYLFGSKVMVETDHKPLTHLTSMTNDNKKIMRWIQVLQQFNLHISYLPGKDNVPADALSRGWEDSSPDHSPFSKRGGMLDSTIQPCTR